MLFVLELFDLPSYMKKEHRFNVGDFTKREYEAYSTLA